MGEHAGNVAGALEEAERRLLERVRTTRDQVGTTFFPHAADPLTGAWRGEPAGNWTSGYWVGLCLRAADRTEDQALRAYAVGRTLDLSPHAESRTHDIGFIFFHSAVLGWERTQDPTLRALALRAAKGLAAMFHPRAEVIPVGAHAEVAAGTDDVTIDCMMNLQLLWWAWQQTGDPRYRDVALAHARRTAAWHVRPDGGVTQSIHFDPQDGSFRRRDTHQGFSPETSWSRGLGWCAYGFARAYEATREPEFLAVAERGADYYWRHAPADRVPFYDFGDPAIPDALRDTSAAAILAAALLLLHRLAPAPPAPSYRERAAQVLASLAAGYLTPLGPDDRRPAGMLLQGCYNKHTGEAPKHELIWGDYYLLEALQEWRGTP
jgi:unsaturated chondroitin disaccharide hydrolase